MGVVLGHVFVYKLGKYYFGQGFMPNKASPAKRLRRDTKKRLANKSAISRLRTLIKKVDQSQGDAESLQAAQKALAMAASKGIIHKNTAARKTSRLMKKAVSTSASV